jgi:hypothetical protein
LFSLPVLLFLSFSSLLSHCPSFFSSYSSLSYYTPATLPLLYYLLIILLPFLNPFFCFSSYSCVGFSMTLSVARLYSAEWMDDTWMTTWKGFGRKQSLPSQPITPEFASTDWGKPRRASVRTADVPVDNSSARSVVPPFLLAISSLILSLSQFHI